MDSAWLRIMVDCPKETGRFAGMIILSQPDHYPTPELGWMLQADAEGKGYAFEGATAARDWARRTQNFPRLVSYIHEENVRSMLWQRSWVPNLMRAQRKRTKILKCSFTSIRRPRLWPHDPTNRHNRAPDAARPNAGRCRAVRALLSRPNTRISTAGRSMPRKHGASCRCMRATGPCAAMALGRSR